MYGKRWTLPVEGHVGYIESLSGFVLGVRNDSTTSGTIVDLEMKKKPISEGQKWIKGKASVNGWFNLTNPNSRKTLEFHFDENYEHEPIIEGIFLSTWLQIFNIITL